MMITETPARTELNCGDPTPEQVPMIAAEFIDDNPAGEVLQLKTFMSIYELKGYLASNNTRI